MVVKEILVLVTFSVLVICTEMAEVEQKKRGVEKGSSINLIPTGSQKPDYTYNVYQGSNSQNIPQTSTYQSPSNPQSSAYQLQASTSLYPNQGSSGQYYSTSSSTSDSSYPPQPQLNLIPPQIANQFVPINFISNPGYPSKYHILPAKMPNGHMQLSIVSPTQSLPYPQTLFASSNNLYPASFLSPLTHGHFNIPSFSSLLGSPYLSQPSSMIVIAQPNPSLYHSFLYPNPAQTTYSPLTSQTKYSPTYNSLTSLQDYNKLSGSFAQNPSKEDNEVNPQNNEYVNPSDSNDSYKTIYTPSRGTSYSS